MSAPEQAYEVAAEQARREELDAKRAADSASKQQLAAAAPATAAAPGAGKPPSTAAKAGKPRIDAVDGCRFALVLPIVVAHFARFGTNNPQLLKLLTQENVLVGGFFVISGYVSGYTATLLGERKADERKLAKPELFFWQKVMGYYPLHVLVSSLFAPMFVWVERQFGASWQTISFRAFLNYTMLQAWFPKEAEIWNQPTWFLSALTFSNLTMPTFVLPQVAHLGKDGLRKLLGGLTAISVLQKISYSETSRFHSRNIATSRPQYPLIWNLTRFHPFWALVEMTMGVAAVRDVMLDTEEDRRKKPNPLLFLLASYASLLLRLTPFDFNDAIIRGTIFVPLFTKFLTELHRDGLRAEPSAVTRFFGGPVMTKLGSLAFPLFICHGPIGQVFYKKVVARKLWGKPMPRSFFPVYLVLCILSSHFLNESFVKSKTVGRWSSQAAQFLAARTDGLLQDRGE